MATIDLKRLVQHKKEGYYPSFVHFDTVIPANDTAEILTYVPTDKAYIFTKGVHDVEVDVFTHKYLKDGKLVMPETKITGDVMTYTFTEPFITINILHGYIRNLDTRYSHRFCLSVYMMVCDVTKIEQEIW